MTSIGGQTPTYDQNGDVLNDFLNSYSWDANGRPVTVDSVTLTYDALGRMVEQDKSGTYTEIVYSPMGNKLAFMSGQTLSKAYVPLPTGAIATYFSSGLTNYHHMDWLGSFRFASNTNRTKSADTAYGPFGEPYATSGTPAFGFTGPTQDTASNVYDFLAREYGIQGRWPSPDPAGLASVDPSDPQTWNRYAYLRNSPLEGTDPTGMDDCWGMPDGEVNQGTAEYVQCEQEQMFGDSATGSLSNQSGQVPYTSPGLYTQPCAPSGATLTNSCNAGYQGGQELTDAEGAWEKYVNAVSGSSGPTAASDWTSTYFSASYSGPDLMGAALGAAGLTKPGDFISAHTSITIFGKPTGGGSSIGPNPPTHVSVFPKTPSLALPAQLKPTCSVPTLMKQWLQQLKAWLTNNPDSQLPLEFQQPPAWVVSCATP